MKTNESSPKTGEKLKHKELIPNLDKRGDISEFLGEHPELYEQNKVYLSKFLIEQLLTAVRNKEIKEVIELLNRDPRLLTANLIRSYTIFHLSAQSGSPELVEAVLKILETKKLLDKIPIKPADFDPIHLNTLLQRSLEQGSRYPFSPAVLLKLGANLEQPESSSKNTLLHRLVIQGNLEAVKWLLEQGAALESRNLESNTPLILSVLHGHVELTQYLLESKADSEVLDGQGKSPFYLAVERKDSKESQELIELLLDKGANPAVACGAEKLTPLHLAAQQGNVYAVKRLLKVKVKVDALSASGNTPLHLAAIAGQEEVIPLLLEAGASRKIKNAVRKTAIDLASSPAIADLIERTAEQIEQARIEEIVRLRQLVEEQASRIEQLEKELTQMKLRMAPEGEVKEKSEVSKAPPAPLILSKPNPKLSLEEIQTFLNHVVAGAQPKAEAMLKQKPELALATGTVTDHTKRTFKNITGFQYAVWALDWQMWKMIRNYLPIEAAREQAKGFKEGAWVAEYGEHADWKKLIEVQQTLIDNSGSWDVKKIDEFWVQQIGGAQLLLPMHVLQEYNNPARSFSPCPKFDAEYDLERVPNTLAGRALCFNLKELGISWAIVRWDVRGGAWLVSPRAEWRANYKNIYLQFWENLSRWVQTDQVTLVACANTRVQQRADLVAQLLPKQSPSPLR